MFFFRNERLQYSLPEICSSLIAGVTPEENESTKLEFFELDKAYMILMMILDIAITSL